MFVKRSLTEKERDSIRSENVTGYRSRWPESLSWDWAIDESRDIYFTQLMSTGMEMREHRYWYLLLIRNNPVMVMFTGEWITVNNVGFHSTRFTSFGSIRNPDQACKAHLIAVINEAVSVLCEDKTLFHFTD